MSTRAGTLLFGLAVIAAPLSGAGELSHEVRAGESASAIAKHYYGSFELAELLHRAVDHVGDVLLRGHIAMQIDRCIAKLLSEGVARAILNVAKHHLATFADEESRRALTKATSRTSDCRNLSFESRAH